MLLGPFVRSRVSGTVCSERYYFPTAGVPYPTGREGISALAGVLYKHSIHLYRWRVPVYTLNVVCKAYSAGRGATHHSFDYIGEWVRYILKI